MHVSIVYNQPAAGASAAEADVLQQVARVGRALDALGHDVEEVPCTLDLATLREALGASPPDCVFNLVESLDGSDRLAALVPVLLDLHGIPYTGCIALTSLRLADKVSVKRALRAAGLATPDWVVCEGAGSEVACNEPARGRFILKPRFEHASVGLDDGAVVEVGDIGELTTMLSARSGRLGIPLFAERFMAGREFNIAMVGDADGAMRLMEPAEIDFSAFPRDKLRIVGWDAKWDDASFEYHATPRKFDFPEHDRELLRRLADCCGRAWDQFSGLGYARIDFRTDENDNPYILEINSNPCLSPDAGFYAAVEQSGYRFEDAVQLMLECAIGRAGSLIPPSNAPPGATRQ